MRQGLKSTTASEKTEVGYEFGILSSTVSGVFSKLNQLGLLGNTPISPSMDNRSQLLDDSQQSDDAHNQLSTDNHPNVASHTPTIDLESASSQEEYATRADLERLETAIVGLSELLTDEKDEESNEYPEESYQEQGPLPEQTRAILEESSMKQMGTWIFAKNLLYFDFARQGAFGGVLEKFDGNWSDFVNIVIDDYFNQTSNVGIGLLSKRFA